MKCILEPTEETRDGKRKHVCKRQCTGNDGKVREFWIPIGNRFSHPDNCTGPIGLGEPGEILDSIAAGLGIPQAIQTAQQWIWKGAGSPLGSLPPGIPFPAIDPIPAPTEGPGTELETILREVGAPEGCQICKDWRDQMNCWGAVGCREHRAEIIARLKQATYETWISDSVKIGFALMREPWFRLSDPLGSCVDEAIRRVESG